VESLKGWIDFLKDERGDALQATLIAALLLGGFYAVWRFFIKEPFFNAGQAQGEWIRDGYEQADQVPGN
jgi:hypothetical protein